MQGIATNKKIFDKLNAAQHLIYEKELFTTTPVAEYWCMSDLLPMFDLDVADAFSYKSPYTLKEIFYANAPKDVKSKNPDKMAALFENNVNIHADANKFDADLSRFMSWALIREIAKHKPTEIYQVYFMFPGNNFETVHENARALARIRLRDFEKDYYKQLSGIINNLKANYSIVNREIKTCFFGGMSAADIKDECKLPWNAKLLDYMNDRLLYAYGNLLKTIVKRYDSEPGIKTDKTLQNIARNESIYARQNFIFKKPENNFETSSIAAVEKWYNQEKSKFAKKWIYARVR
ncbi:MAG: hypothetical protein J6T57_00990 [Alphaproteobacteria bacterium]|nr:hypothetical protein [Alphaproteobacteria bacterium]